MTIWQRLLEIKIHPDPLRVASKKQFMKTQDGVLTYDEEEEEDKQIHFIFEFH